MKKEKEDLIFRILTIIVFSLSGLLAAAFAVPSLLADQFRIGGSSMSPTLGTGDHVLVNKLLMGGRIYTKYDFSDPDMECFRMPGFRDIRPGDVAVFNYPFGREGRGIEFKMNYVYAKRCVGCPGDSVSIVNGYYANNHTPGPIGDIANQDFLSSTPDSVLASMGVVLGACFYAPEKHWTIKDYGPLYIPAKGDRIPLDTTAAKLYASQIEFETGFFPEITKDGVRLDGRPMTEYEFASDWYFFGGDNVINSKDSRYIGLVPKDYIVGVATRIIYTESLYKNKLRWKRIPRPHN